MQRELLDSLGSMDDTVPEVDFGPDPLPLQLATLQLQALAAELAAAQAAAQATKQASTVAAEDAAPRDDRMQGVVIAVAINLDL